MQLTTIGYEGAKLADFVATLLDAKITLVIDVREIAQSRRPGFSKNALRMALADAGIDYFHIRQLGDPKHGREAARSGNFDLFRSIFTAHMDLPASREAVSVAVELASEKAAALLCFEREPKHCHRTIVAERMIALRPFDIKHLGVQSRARGIQDAGSADRFVGAC